MRIRSFQLSIIVILTALLFGPLTAGAAPITFYYTGTVTSVTDTNSELDGSIVSGTVMAGSITFESSTPDSETDTDEGRYVWNNATSAGAFSEMTIGNYGFQSGPIDSGNFITVFDNRLSGTTGFIEDAYVISSSFVQVFGPTFPLFVPSPEAHASFGMTLLNRVLNTNPPSPLLDVISSDALPVIPPQVGLFVSNSFTLSDQIGTKVISGTLTSLNLIASDVDNDGTPDDEDNCVTVANPGQEDGDGDGVGDACDNCPEEYNADQVDADNDGLGDACDPFPDDSNNELAQALEDLAQAEADLAQALADLDTCEDDLAASEGSLTTCEGNLATCDTALTTSQQDLATCDTALTTSQSDLTTCDTALTTSQSDLTTCDTALTTCDTALTTCEGVNDCANPDPDGGAAKGESCTENINCCSNKCKGPSDRKTCK